ncbi:chemotaxis protein CheB [Corallococcus carmarthensis]|uniref:protein-glutamate methylesterase n=1 Tax=Corallococcus carmarthensis TaxID=2316728 RepID=A0A3A8JGA9_9BACT|nr:chemotaxis protein CheB [Corallococcus carmarthensis]NOK23602.1 chemotaxis protein CheB [Corallococcus carmarthensis]RKG93988.1 chemotaxis protein CheB [Corallococcus carmarthensis]
MPTSRQPSATPAGRVDAIVVGASAGGVDALSLLLPTLPADFRPALLVVVHLPRDRPSLLVDVFSPRCALPVHEAGDKQSIQPGTLYFAPPDYHLLVDRDAHGPSLALSLDAPVHFSRPAIDVLFESAADVYGARLGGILLTGANADGAQGLQAVRRAGGVTLVQTPSTARASTMPSAALAAGPVDFVLPLEQMPAVLRAWGNGGAI